MTDTIAKHLALLNPTAMTANNDDNDEYSVFGPGKTIAEPGQHHTETTESNISEPKYQHQEWLSQQYAVLGKTLQEIADDCGVHEKTIWRWVQKFDIDTRSSGPRPGPWEDEEWLRSQYIDQQKSIYQISDEKDCDEKTIRNWLAKHEIDTRDPSEQHPASRENRRYRDEDWLREQYVKNQRTAAEIADKCDVSKNTVYRWLDRYGIETRSVSEARRLTEARSVQKTKDEQDDKESEDVIKRAVGQGRYEGPETGLDLSSSYKSNLGEQNEAVESPYRNKEWLREQYDETESASEIAERCNVDPGTIYYWLDKHGIERSRGNENARYRDKNWIEAAYDDLGTLESVAQECGVSPGTIRNWLVRFDIERNLDAVSEQSAGGRPEKTLDDLLDALINLHEETSRWMGPSEYDEKRAQLSSAPSSSWLYNKSPGGISSWSEAVEMAKTLADGDKTDD